ncbi:MAG: hypothetical protein C3F12_14435 [Candidatus Methylomirabilota bacterium]|nr:periplasmic heavy metal sensor [Candidatus Methylomirabilis sp.]PWB42398.1 MAG: hypothetical protein C3F12_14435 [candidate division NC10 bacterium]
MRAVTTAILVLAGVAGSMLVPIRTPVASAQEESADPDMMGHRMLPDVMHGIHEMVQGMTGPWLYGQGGHRGPLISLMLMWRDQLGLSTEQERSLQELRTGFEKESIKRTADIDVAELELKGLLETDKVDLVKVEALAKKIAMLRADLRVARIKTIEAGKAVLTPEQQDKFRRLARESTMGRPRMEMMGPRTPPRHPGVQ